MNSEDYIQESYNDLFNQTKQCLKKLVDMESIHGFLLKTEKEEK